MTNVSPIRETADDGWGTQADDYSIAEFYCKATDGRGHSDNLRVRVKPEMAGEVAALVSSGRIPDYTTPQDFIRDAMVHRLRWLSENVDDRDLSARLADKVRTLVMKERADQHLAFHASFDEFVQSLIDVCEEDLKKGDHHHASQFLDYADEYAAGNREPYSTMVRTVVERYRAQVVIEDEIPADVAISDITPEDGEA